MLTKGEGTMNTMQFTPRSAGKRLKMEALANQPGAYVAKPEGIFRWDGTRWRKVRALRPA